MSRLRLCERFEMSSHDEDLDHLREAINAEAVVLGKRIYDMITERPMSAVAHGAALVALANVAAHVLSGPELDGNRLNWFLYLLTNANSQLRDKEKANAEDLW